MRPKILLAAMGSHGDLNPMIAIGQALERRGARAVVGCSSAYRQKVLDSGLEFAAIRPDMPDAAAMAAVADEIMDPIHGAQAIVERFVMPGLRNSWADTLGAAQGCDAIVAGALCLAAPMAAEFLGIPWASAALQPMIHFSAFDPPTVPAAPWLDATRGWGRAGAALRRALLRAGKLRVRLWCAEHARLRRRLGLRPEPDPLFATSRSPWLCLSMFPDYFARAQPDWPDSSLPCGFPRADPIASEAPPRELAAFLDSGEPPLTFTLGTAAVHAAGSFYQEGRRAAQALGRRAVFLTGPDGINAMHDLPASMIAVPYAPHAWLFPRSLAVAHSCGVGTCAAALLSGTPSLAVPWANDQPDNARRLALLGAALVLPRERFDALRAMDRLLALTGDPSHKEASLRLARIEADAPNGADVAAEGLLARLARA